ncbi:hypothetical protein A4H97_10870 [Niastella yeongjuensis]|uniref:ABM domain-containing protein n=1 Tax=Niastella yeongjuensis TaxID=354355 RepID=A0A1V9EFF6_9BACT|nr:putative quinol monooxygenase [Niastella yeongjuensis]OQP44853.1 hypothetical protein A4H97_10870 [Niastella yeongjuensis]SEP41932.1 Quinol monooxygenase YgiN [Niastella yeongjuensis]
MKYFFLIALLFFYEGNINSQINTKMNNAGSISNKVTNDGKKFSLIATIEILPGYEAAVKKALFSMAAETRKESGVELFLINTKNDLPNTILIYETYQSEAAFELHKSLPHARSFFEFTKGKIKDDKIDVVLLTAIDN